MKESFVLFAEQKELIEKLSDEQAGKVLKAIFSYVADDAIPEDINNDLAVDIIFTALKQSIDRNTEKWEETKQRRSEAGKKGAEKRWGATTENGKNGNAIANDSKNSNAINEMAKMAVSVSVPVSVSDSVSVIGEKKTSKRKVETPKVDFAKYVSMQQEEYDKLVEERGEDFTKRCVETLNNYKGSTGKKYKDDYLAIRSWVIKRVEEELPHKKIGNPFFELLEEEQNAKRRNDSDTRYIEGSISSILPDTG